MFYILLFLHFLSTAVTHCYDINLIRFKDEDPIDFLADNIIHPNLDILKGNAKDRILKDSSKTFHQYLQFKYQEWENEGLPRMIQRELSNVDHKETLDQYCNWIKDGQLVMIGGMSEKVYHLIDSLSNRFDVPYLTWDWNFHEGVLGETQKSHDPRETSCRVFTLKPDLTEPLVDFLHQYKWNSFGYLYASEEGFSRMQSVTHKLSIRKVNEDSVSNNPDSGNSVDDLEVESAFLDFSSASQIHGVLTRLDFALQKHKHVRKVVIDLSGDRIGSNQTGHNRLIQLFSWLAHMGMLREEYHYLLVDFRLFDLPLAQYKESGVNVSGFHMFDMERASDTNETQHWNKFAGLDWHSLALIDDTFLVMKHIVRKLKDKKFSPSLLCQQDKEESSNITQKWNLGMKIATELTKLSLNSKITNTLKFDPITCKRRGHFLTVSRATMGSTRVVAKWTPETDNGWQEPSKNFPDKGTLKIKDSSKEQDRSNRVYRIVTIINKPFVFEKNASSLSKEGKENFQGYCVDLANHIFNKRLNLNYEIHLVNDNIYGKMLPNGSWNGIIGELLNGKADVAIAPLTVNPQRAKVVLFTEPYMNFGLSLMVMKPEKTKPGTFSFLNPLTSGVWVALLLAGILIAIIFTILGSISPKENKKRNETDGFTFTNSLWFSLASFVHQGIDLFPVSPSTRLVAATWRFLCLVLTAYYTANLAAALSVGKLISPISSLKDLVDKRDLGFKVGLVGDGSTQEFFRSSTDPLYSRVYELMKQQPKEASFVTGTDSGVNNVRNGKYAFILESKMNEYYNLRQPCNTMQIGEVFTSKTYAVAVAPGMMELKEDITDAILRMREDQDLAKLYTEWWISKGECPDGTEENKSEELALGNLSGAFYILIAGMLLAMMTGGTILVLNLNRNKWIEQS